MKFLIAIAALLSTGLASPLFHAKRQCFASTPSILEAETTIAAWLSDISTVNAFLDNIPGAGSPDLAGLASTTLQTAQDEPNRLSILAAGCPTECNCDEKFSQAITDIENKFGEVTSNLQLIGAYLPTYAGSSTVLAK